MFKSRVNRSLVAMAAGLLAICSCGRAGAADSHPPAHERVTTSSTTTASTAVPRSTSEPPSSTTALSTTTSTTSVPRFSWSATPLDAATTARMRSSWRPTCPVPLRDLRYVTLSYWGFDGQQHQGELAVHEDAVDDLHAAFSTLFALHFPIRQMRLVDDFGGDDDRSMAADNTSAFNCRPVAGSTRWSQHAFGRAVDINPVENPYLHQGTVSPPAGTAFLDRLTARPGMLLAVVTR